jgi:trans-aconitate methyltransferase
MTPTDWQTRIGDVWAAEWRRTDRSLANLSSRLNAAILAAAPRDSGGVLDIGCGAGATSLALAAARPDLAVTGIDLSPALVAIARERVPRASFHVADAAQDEVNVRPDLIVSRHGVMFFADPVAAFRRLHTLASPGAPLVFSCFRDRAHNPWAGDLVAEVAGTMPVSAAGYAPGPFGFADPALVADILARAGWRAAVAEPVDFAYVAGEGDDPIADAVSYFTRIGPLASTIAAADPADRPGLIDRLATALAHRRADSCVQFPASAWVWSAEAGKSA